MGSYVVKCDEMTGGISGYGPLTLDIWKWKGDTFIAAFDFGKLKGTMMLSRAMENLKFIETHESRALSLADADPNLWRDMYPHHGIAKFNRSRPRFVQFLMRGYQPDRPVFYRAQHGNIKFSGGCEIFCGMSDWLPLCGAYIKFEDFKVSDIARQKPRG